MAGGGYFLRRFREIQASKATQVSIASHDITIVFLKKYQNFNYLLFLITLIGFRWCIIMSFLKNKIRWKYASRVSQGRAHLDEMSNMKVTLSHRKRILWRWWGMVMIDPWQKQNMFVVYREAGVCSTKLQFGEKSYLSRISF